MSSRENDGLEFARAIRVRISEIFDPDAGLTEASIAADKRLQRVTLLRLDSLATAIRNANDAKLKALSTALKGLNLEELIKVNCHTHGSDPADPEKCQSCSSLTTFSALLVNRSATRGWENLPGLTEAAFLFDATARTWSAIAHSRAPELLESVLSGISDAEKRNHREDIFRDTKAAPMIVTSNLKLRSLVYRLGDAESRAQHVEGPDACSVCLETKAAAASLTTRAYHVTRYLPDEANSRAWVSELLDRCILLKKAIETKCTSIHQQPS